MESKVVPLDKAREQRQLEEQEKRADDLKNRFAKALGLQDKPKKRSVWKRVKSKKPR